MWLHSSMGPKSEDNPDLIMAKLYIPYSQMDSLGAVEAQGLKVGSLGARVSGSG